MDGIDPVLDSASGGKFTGFSDHPTIRGEPIELAGNGGKQNIKI